MNPARSFGPALISGDLAGYWIYVAGPVAGACFAVLVAFLLHGKHGKDEHNAAWG